VRNDSQIAGEFMETGLCGSCPVIDMHGHYGPFRGIYLPMPWADGMLEMMDRSGVCCIVCSSHSSLADAERGNREMAQVVTDHPGRFYAYRTVNPNYPEQVKDEVARFPEDEGFVGFKFHPSGHSYPITGDNYVPALEYADEHRLLLLSHTWGSSEYDGPSLLGQVAERYPNVTFLMGHSGYGEWEAALAVARERANVYLELTAASRVSGIITRMVGEVGSEKIVFGTDLPWFDPHFGIGSVCFSRIADEDRHNILHRNAERLLAPFRARQEG
jgi:predicted TIM-barrel fold metal-dependent hydrolase